VGLGQTKCEKTESYNMTIDLGIPCKQPTLHVLHIINTSRNTLYHELQSSENNYTFVCRRSLDSVCTSTTPMRLTQQHVLGNKHCTQVSQSVQTVHWLAIELDTFPTQVRRCHKV
jgi:hypothetical protein